MLVIGDVGHYHGRFPWMTATLVVINVIVYSAQVIIGETFTNGFAVVPEEIVSFRDFQGTKYHKAKVEVEGTYDKKGQYHPKYETKYFPVKHYTGPFPVFLTLFTSMFMHGDIFHLIGNMWFLLIFGRNVECAMNHGRFLAFYTACGLAASIAHVASDPHSILPCLGASGAISGVMGAYISIHPLNTIKVWFGFWIGVIELPAIAVIGVWFVLNYLSAFISLDNEYRDGVAYWAHIGGFLAGFAIIRVVVFYLQWRKSKGDLEEEEPLAPVQKDVLGDALPPKVVGSVSAPAPAPVEVTSVQVPEGPDPFAAFLTTQSVRKLQVQKPRESTDHR